LLRGYTSYWYNRVNGDTAVFVWDSVYSCVVPL
jgi:hypothetical protein